MAASGLVRAGLAHPGEWGPAARGLAPEAEENETWVGAVTSWECQWESRANFLRSRVIVCR